MPPLGIQGMNDFFGKGVASENGKNRTVSNWHGPTSRKRSFLRCLSDSSLPSLAYSVFFSKTTIETAASLLGI